MNIPNKNEGMIGIIFHIFAWKGVCNDLDM